MTEHLTFRGRVLSIAGSDSGGGAGIQADIKTVSALGGYAMTAVTALTAQNTLGIEGIIEVDPDFVVLQARMCALDIGVDAIKIGMLPSEEHIVKVAAFLTDLGQDTPVVPVVIDPVMRASTGASLSSEGVLEVFQQHLFPVTTVLTPNIVEAAALTGLEVRTVEGMAEAGTALCSRGVTVALITGGHLEGTDVHDVLVTAQGRQVFSAPRLDATNTHGTGCTLSSALATGLAFGKTVEVASEEAIRFVREAIKCAGDLGAGSGPLNHQFGNKGNLET